MIPNYGDNNSNTNLNVNPLQKAASRREEDEIIWSDRG
jgi:hypothetical protein